MTGGHDDVCNDMSGSETDSTDEDDDSENREKERICLTFSGMRSDLL